MFSLVGSLIMSGSITVNATGIYQIHACVNLRDFHVNLGDSLLRFGNFGNSDEIWTELVRISYEFRTNLEILVKFAEGARNIRTNFVQICQIRTFFVRDSHKFVRNSYECCATSSNSGPKGQGRNSRIFVGRHLGLMGPFGMGPSLNHGD